METEWHNKTFSHNQHSVVIFYRCTVHFDICKVPTPTNALFIKLDKVLKSTLKITSNCSYMFRSLSTTIIREPSLKPNKECICWCMNFTFWYVKPVVCVSQARWITFNVVHFTELSQTFSEEHFEACEIWKSHVGVNQDCSPAGCDILSLGR